MLSLLCALATAAVFPSSMPADREALNATLDEGFGAAMNDDWLRGNVGLVLRPRLTFVASPLTPPAFSMNMARPQLRVSAWQKRLKLFVQPELADPVRLLDAEVSVQPWPYFGVRVGRFVTSFSRSFATPVPKLKFPDFAASNTLFRVDRDIGVSVLGAVANKRFDYDVGVFSGGSFLPTPQDRGLVMLLARVSAHPLGFLALDENACKDGDCPLRVGIGANAYYRLLEARDETLAVLGNEQQGAAGLDVALIWGLVQLQAEVYYRLRLRPGSSRIDQLGGYVHGAIALIPSWLELALRVDFIDRNLHAGRDQAWTFDALLVTYVLGEHAQVWLQYSYKLETDAHALLLQLQFWI